MIQMIEELLNYLETTSLEPHDDYTTEFTYKEQKELYKYIKNLQKENEMLHHYKTLYQSLKRQKEEFRSWLEYNWTLTQDIWFCKIINKIRKLEKGESD